MNFMPFGQLKSFLKILIEVQYQTLVIDSENKKAALLVTGEWLKTRSWKPALFLKNEKSRDSYGFTPQKSRQGSKW